MASKEVCEMRLVIAAALTARQKTSNGFQDSDTKHVHVLASLSRQADRYDQPADTGELGAVEHENRRAAGFRTSGRSRIEVARAASAADRPAGSANRTRDRRVSRPRMSTYAATCRRAWSALRWQARA